ncbi:MAG: hypothetical protein JWM11_7248 [Planctomycetaceae bacterium]|nr:hypothetical protein [Planctomycetaceae bacterium]
MHRAQDIDTYVNGTNVPVKAAFSKYLAGVVVIHHIGLNAHIQPI